MSDYLNMKGLDRSMKYWEWQQHLFGPGHAATLATINALSVCFMSLGQYEVAEKLFVERSSAARQVTL